MASYSPNSDFTNFRYNGPSYTGQTAICLANLFLPNSEKPADGYPCVLAPATDEWSTTWTVNAVGEDNLDTVNNAWQKAFLDNGIAVCLFSVTVPRSYISDYDTTFYQVPYACEAGAADDGTCSVDDIDISEPVPPTNAGNTNNYGPPYVSGFGVVHSNNWELPNDFIDGQGGPTGGGLHPYQNGDWPMSIKDGVAILQYCIENAEAMQINPNKFISYGQDAASYVMWHVANNIELSKITWPNGSGQELNTTKGRFVARVAGISPTLISEYMRTDNSFLVYNCFLATSGDPDYVNPLEFDTYDKLAIGFGTDGADLVGGDYGTSEEMMLVNSPLDWVTYTSNIQEANQQIPTYLFNYLPTDDSYDTSAVKDGPYEKTNTTDKEDSWHSIWYQAAMAKALNRGKLRSVCVEASTAATIVATDDTEEKWVSFVLVDEADQPQDMINWLFATADIQRAPPGGEVGTKGTKIPVPIKKRIISKAPTTKGSSYPMLGKGKNL